MNSRHWNGHVRGDGGAAVIWVVAAACVIAMTGAAMVAASSAVVARHRTQSVADLVAIAAAQSIGRTSDVCAAAEKAAAANGAALVRCSAALDAGGRSGSVRVEVRRSVRLPLAGSRLSVARARAGRLPR